MKFNFIIPILLIFVVACDSGIKSGNELSTAELQYMREIGLLTDNENIIRFASHSFLNNTSGSFISDKRLAYYWVDQKKETNVINSAMYSEIDTLITKDLSDAWTYSSYIKVIKKDSSEFKVYVDDNSKKTNEFFKKAISEWQKRKK